MRARGRVVVTLALLLGGPAGVLSVQGDDSLPATVTLVMDDLAYDRALARRTLALPRPFTAAILPESPLAEAVAAEAAANGIDVMLHLPMDTGNAQAAYPITVTGDMTPEQIRATVRAGLAALPTAVAVNNHEGSALTGDRQAMAVVMDELARSDDLLFVDSRTDPATVAEQEAVRAGLAATRRNVFLDHDPAPAAVERAVDEWLETAQRQGCALAIGHPRPATLAVLERRLGELGEAVERVDLATYIERCGHQP